METIISKIQTVNQTDFLFKKALMSKFGINLIFQDEKTAVFETSTEEAAEILLESIAEFSKTHYLSSSTEVLFCKDNNLPALFCTCPNCRRLGEQSRKFKIGALAPYC